MAKHTLSISGQPWRPRVEVDGHEITSGIRRILVDIDARHGRLGHSVELDLAVDAIEIRDFAVEHPDFVVSMSAEARDALIKLGWTPPSDAASGQ